MSNLLYDESPLTFSPTIAKILGLNSAIILQQLHYWLDKNAKSQNNIRDGKVWCYDTYEKWRERSFPFWSVDTIKRTFLSLEKKGIVISRQYGKYERNRVKWYTIDYRVLNGILQKGQMDLPKKTNPSGQIAPMDEGNLTRSMSADCTDLYNIYNTYNHTYTETTTETTQKNKVIGNFSGKKFDQFSSLRYGSMDELANHVIAVCHECFGDDETLAHDVVNVVIYYFQKYFQERNEDHPRLNNACMEKVIDALVYGTESGITEGIAECGVDHYIEMINRYFDTNFNDCNYNILHFISDNIRDNRTYEVQMA